MIDLVNNQYLTQEQRKNSLFRAMRSQSFFNLMSYELIGVADNRFQYAAKVQVDKDFYVTEVKGNFADVFSNTAAFFGASLYISGTGRSLVRFLSNELLPTSHIMTDARAVSTANGIPTGKFDDRQREILPTLIPRGDSLISQVQNTTAKEAEADIDIVVSGYYLQPNVYMPERTAEGVNESFAKDIEFDQWKFEILDDAELTANETRILNNDRFARMVLGFGIRVFPSGTAFSDDIVTAKIIITDVYRNLKFNNEPIEMSFFAPKVPQVADAHMYLLPVEHFWEPFAPLKFNFSEIAFTNEAGAKGGFQWIMLTRTV